MPTTANWPIQRASAADATAMIHCPWSAAANAITTNAAVSTENSTGIENRPTPG